MSALSSFELLAAPIIPTNIGPLPPEVPNPIVVQAYFILLTALPDSPNGSGTMTLTFYPNEKSVGLPGKFDDPPLPLAFLDLVGGGGNTNVVPVPGTVNFQVSWQIAKGETFTFLLQPDLGKILPKPGGPKYDLRGYVTMSAPGLNILVAPQTRGTFLDFVNSDQKNTQPQRFATRLLIPETTAASPGDPKPQRLSVVAEEGYGLPTVYGNVYRFQA